MEMVLIRHGEPDWEPDGRAVDEPELTPFGRAQAERTAEALAHTHFDALYVSPLRRAMETMEPIAKRLGLEPKVESSLAELRLPPLEGRTEEEVLRFFQQARARELEHWWDGFPGGESFRHFYERISSGIEGLLTGGHRVEIHEDAGHRLWFLPEEEQHKRLLIVAHEGTNAVILSHLLGIEAVPWAWMRFSSRWCGMAFVRAAPVARGAVWVLDGFNRIDHLEGLERP
jgi:broad specificity phosphatase PhoE